MDAYFSSPTTHRRFEEGPASDDIDLDELNALDRRFEGAAYPDSPSWATVTALFLPLRAIDS